MSAAQLEPTLPTSWYRSAEVFRAEKERIFCREWIGVCREEELPDAGDHRVLDVLGESVLLVRNREGALRAFYNVCRHRGSVICTESRGRVARLTCPYHAWSYGLDGALLAARLMPVD